MLRLALAAALALAAPALPQSRDPRYQEEWRRGTTAIQNGEFSRGIESMKRCLEIVPGQPMAAYNIACAHALRREPEPAFEWLARATDFGFGPVALIHPEHAAKVDPDLALLRTDARFAALIERMRAGQKRIDEWGAKPLVYVPAALAGETPPLVVVLHGEGETRDALFAHGPWKALADELGFALVLPSGRSLANFGPEWAPEKGLAWFNDSADFLAQAEAYEQPVPAALEAAAEACAFDPARVLIVGDGQGAAVAFDVALARPERFRGVLLLSGGVFFERAREHAPAAVERGLRVRVLVDRDLVWGVEPGRERVEAWTAQFERGLRELKLDAALERFERKTGGSAATRLAAALRPLLAP